MTPSVRHRAIEVYYYYYYYYFCALDAIYEEFTVHTSHLTLVLIYTITKFGSVRIRFIAIYYSLIN